MIYYEYMIYDFQVCVNVIFFTLVASPIFHMSLTNWANRCFKTDAMDYDNSDPGNEPIPLDMISRYIVLELVTAEIHEKSDFGLYTHTTTRSWSYSIAPLKHLKTVSRPSKDDLVVWRPFAAFMRILPSSSRTVRLKPHRTKGGCVLVSVYGYIDVYILGLGFFPQFYLQTICWLLRDSANARFDRM